MTKSFIFIISLDKQPPIYYAGDSIIGAVKLYSQTGIRLRRLYLHFQGYVSIPRRNSPLASTGNQEYFLTQKVTIWDDDSSLSRQSKNWLAAGTHELKFKYLLPNDSNMPSSFDGGYLSTIQYKITCHLDRPLAQDFTCHHPFTYIQTVALDLSDDTIKRPLEPAVVAIKNSFRSLFFQYGQIKLIAKTDRKGYYPDEMISVYLHCENLSKVTLPAIDLQLVRCLTAYAPDNEYAYKNSQILLSQRINEPIRRGETVFYFDQQIPVPSISPTTPPHICYKDKSSITVEYHIQITAVTPYGRTTCCQLPITIGSRPILDHNQHDHQIAMDETQL